jgi:hypothetical protein
MPAFGHVASKQIGFTGRVSTRSRDEVRQLLGLLDVERYVMLTFGGHAALQLATCDSDAPIKSDSAVRRWKFVAVDPSPVRADEQVDSVLRRERMSALLLCALTQSDAENGVIYLRLAALRAVHGIRFVDVLSASDVVVTKPGYGTVSEIVLNRRPALWVSRPNFAEESYLVASLERFAVAKQIDAAIVLQMGAALIDEARAIYAKYESEAGKPDSQYYNVKPENETAVKLILEFAAKSSPTL